MNQWTVCSVYTETDLSEYFFKKISDNAHQEQKRKIGHLIKSLGKQNCFVATDTVDSKTYDLIKDAPGLFVEFASLGNGKASDKEALAWVRDFGPVCREPFDMLGKEPLRMTEENEPIWRPSSSREKIFELESACYWSLGEYIILKDVVINLATIVFGAFRLWQAIYGEDRNMLEKCLSTLQENDKLHEHIKDLINPVHMDWDTVRREVSKYWLLPMVQYYMTGAMPAFEVIKGSRRRNSANNTDAEGNVALRYKRTWDVPDQWRAMWAHFYDQLVNNAEVRKCDYCGKLFLVTDKRQTYCQPRPGAKRSRCQNTVAMANFRAEK